MSERTVDTPPMDDIYDANAEYYDTISTTRAADLDGALTEFATAVEADGPPVLDIGAGTGKLTVRLAQLIEPCEIIAIEPTRGLRAVLASRVAEDERLARQITIVPRTIADASPMLPDEIGGAIAFGVLPHLGAAERNELLRLFVERLSPTGRALVELMPPWTNDPIPLTPFADATQGRHRIEGFMQARPVDDDQLCWTMTYRRIDQDGTVLHEASADSVCWVTAPDAFEAEAQSVGLGVEWPSPDLALVTRSTTAPGDAREDREYGRAE